MEGRKEGRKRQKRKQKEKKGEEKKARRKASFVKETLFKLTRVAHALPRASLILPRASVVQRHFLQAKKKSKAFLEEQPAINLLQKLPGESEYATWREAVSYVDTMQNL